MRTLLTALALTAAASLPSVLSAEALAKAEASAQAGGLLITPDELAAALNDPALVVLAVNEQGFATAHIPGAQVIAYNDFAVDGPESLGSELPPVEQLRALFARVGVSDKSHVVLYGGHIPAARAFFTLDYLGHPSVKILNGGLPAWRAAGLQVESGPAKPIHAGNFNPKAHPEKVALANWINERIGVGAITLIDTRPDPEFTGADGGMGGQHAAGHLAGAHQVVWNTLVDSSTGKFLPDADLRAKFTAAGAKAGTPVVTYCMVGMRASVTYFVARHLGFDAKLYDGSIVDWTKRKLPVKTGR